MRATWLPLVVWIVALSTGCSETTTNVHSDGARRGDGAAGPDLTPHGDLGPGVPDLAPDQAVAAGPCNGYTLLGIPSMAPAGRPVSLLIDMKGNVIKTWSLVNHPVKMLPGGSVIGTGTLRKSNDPGLLEAVTFEQRSWDDKLEWSFSNWDKDSTSTWMARQHHDFEREGNPVGYYAPGQDFVARGKTLILAHKTVSVPKISPEKLMDDVIYEVNWDGTLTGFTWYPSDHIDEMGFEKDALADIYANPCLSIDLGLGDWMHINTVSTLGKNRWYDQSGDERFNPQNLIIDSRQANYIAIISRKTGKIVWRVGPEYSTGKPEAGLGQMVGPHHAHFIPHGLPGAGNVLVYDNGGWAGYGGTGFPRHRRDYSRVVEFDPITLKVVWEYGKARGSTEYYFSGFISSAQRLPNGNTMVTAGDPGYLFEVTRDKRVVWEYRVGKQLKDAMAVDVYRAYRIPPEWLPKGVNPAGYTAWSSLYKSK
jgi:hypothetical protein